MVSGIKAGTATITASVTGGATDACTVYVAKADGAYYIRSVVSVCFLDGGGANIAADNLTNIRQKELLTSGDDRLAQMWKVAYVGGGKYSVRPLHKQNLALSVIGTGNDVSLQDIGTTDTASGVPNSAKWRIFYNQTGYVFQCDGNTSRTLYPAGESGAANVQIGVSTYSTSNTAFRWYMNPTSDITDQILIYDKKTGDCVDTPKVHVKPQETRSLSNAGIEVEFVTLSANRQLQFTSTQPSKVTVNSTTGAITGVTSMSTVVVTVSGSNNSTATTSFLVECSPYRINLDVQYDGGYVDRFAQSSLTAVERINAHMPALRDFYLELFRVDVISNEPVRFTSLADGCNNKDNKGICTCDDFCEEPTLNNDGTIEIKSLHHTNRANVVLREVEMPITTRKMLFIGHKLCKSIGLPTYCDVVLSDGAAWEEYKICAIYHFGNTNNSQENEMAGEQLTVLHEFGHLIGAEDHYGNGCKTTEQMNDGDPNGPFNTFCIYGEPSIDSSDPKYAQLVENPVICDGCKMMIQSYLETNCS